MADAGDLGALQGGAADETEAGPVDRPAVAAVEEHAVKVKFAERGREHLFGPGDSSQGSSTRSPARGSSGA